MHLDPLRILIVAALFTAAVAKPADAATCSQALGNVDSALRSLNASLPDLPAGSAVLSDVNKARNETGWAILIMVAGGNGSAWVTRARTYTKSALNRADAICAARPTSPVCSATAPLFIAWWKLTYTVGNEC